MTDIIDDSDTDLNRRRCMFKIAKTAAATAAAAATLYMAPLVVRIDEAEAKGGSRRGGGSRRRGASGRRRGPSVRRFFPSRRRRVRNRRRRVRIRVN